MRQTFHSGPRPRANPDFDYGPFRELADRLASTETIRTFAYTFLEAGVYVFGDAADKSKKTVIRVVDQHETCPTSAPIVAITATNLVQLGVTKSDHSAAKSSVFSVG